MTPGNLQTVAALAATFFHHSVIGGGAPRDTFLGGPVKDIDLFVDTRGIDAQVFDELTHQFAKSIGGKTSTHFEGSVEGQFDTQHITAPGLPVIEVLPVSRCVFTDVYDYDFGLSQILMTAKGPLRTAAFDTDVKDHTITYLLKDASESGKTRSAARLQRILGKYPGFTPVYCEVLERP